MAKLSTKEIIDALSEMTILEVKDLVDAMKEAFGVDPSAVAVAAAPVAAVEEITGLGLKEAKEVADNGGTVKEKVSADEAAELKAKFEEAGATIELK